MRFAKKYVDADGAQALHGIDAANAGADAAHALHHRGKIDADIGRRLRTVVLGVAHFGV